MQFIENFIWYLIFLKAKNVHIYNLKDKKIKKSF